MSTLSITYFRESRLAAGLKTRPDLQPTSRIGCRVRSHGSTHQGEGNVRRTISQTFQPVSQAHQVHISQTRIPAPRSAHHGPDRQIGHVVVVHDVEMNDVCSASSTARHRHPTVQSRRPKLTGLSENHASQYPRKIN